MFGHSAWKQVLLHIALETQLNFTLKMLYGMFTTQFNTCTFMLLSGGFYIANRSTKL